jgi:hypothetical protein
MNVPLTLTPSVLDRDQLNRVCAVAGILLPGSAESPAPQSLPEFEELVQRAAGTLGRDAAALEDAIVCLPAELSWDSLSEYSEKQPEGFELIALVVIGGYFMSPTVLAALGMPAGERRRAPLELAVDQLDSGLLDAVLERGCPVKTLEDIDQRSAAR